jgi:hypothetical protein
LTFLTSFDRDGERLIENFIVPKLEDIARRKLSPRKEVRSCFELQQMDVTADSELLAYEEKLWIPSAEPNKILDSFPQKIQKLRDLLHPKLSEDLQGGAPSLYIPFLLCCLQKSIANSS